jgi:membrane-bound ClpP family serine protease
MTPLIWVIVLILLGIGFVVLELFIPSGGVLSFFAVVCVTAAIFVGYYYFGPVGGTIVLAVEAVLIPITIVAAIRVWPHTPIGRRVLNITPGEPGSAGVEADSAHALRSLVGKWGRAKTPLLPSGAVTIEGRVYDAISRGVPIEAGQPIEVVQAEGNHIIVRPSRLAAPPENQRAASTEDILAQPVESLGIEPLDDPLGS